MVALTPGCPCKSDFSLGAVLVKEVSDEVVAEFPAGAGEGKTRLPRN